VTRKIIIFTAITIFLTLIIAISSIEEASAGTDPGPSEIEITGMYHIIWPHPDPGSPPDVPSAPGHTLTNGETFNLLGVEKAVFGSGGPHKFNGKVVTVRGIFDPETNQIMVRTMELPIIIFSAENSHILGSHAIGSQKWVTLLCRFADFSGVSPQPLSYFEDEMDLMDEYWRETSYDEINLVGSVEQDWENLPQNRADYLDHPETHFVGHTLNWGEISADCAAAHDANVNFPDFDGINFIFNRPLDGYSWGGGVDLNIDGMVKSYDATWMSPGGWGNQDVLGQEMGHGFGLPHSSGPYTSTYDSKWDVQSAGGTCDVPDADFNCLGVHTVSVHKDALGWIDGSERYIANTDPDQLIFIERLAVPTQAGFLTAQIPIGGSATNFYTIETRKFAGFDNFGDIPGEAILMHKVDTTLEDRNAQVVDVDDIANTNPNDAGAMWLPGELFEDIANGISVGIVEMTDTGFFVIINPTVSDLSIEKTGPPNPVVAGTQITYTVTVDNDGPDTAENVMVVDTLHPSLIYISDTGGCIQGPPDTLTCDLGNIPNGGSDSFDITVEIPADFVYLGGTLVGNEAEVSSDQFDDDTSNNDDVIINEVIAEADVEILSFTASETPDEVMLGDSFGVTLTKTITNNGISSPVDVDALVDASGDGVSIVPTPVFPGVDELEIGEEAQIVEDFMVTCEEPGSHDALFSNEIMPADATDPDLSNNEAEVTVTIECIIPVQINIHPGSFPNPINLKSKNGVVAVAILTTEVGEYGLPVAIDATMVDPLSVHFGPSDVLFDVEPPGGATEFHNQGHLQDTFELDESTKDGDTDMVLHFKAPETELEASDTEACVKGQINIGGMMFTFFGCDDFISKP